MVEPFMKVYDLRYTKASQPIQYASGPSFLRFIPSPYVVTLFARSLFFHSLVWGSLVFTRGPPQRDRDRQREGGMEGETLFLWYMYPTLPTKTHTLTLFDTL